MKVYKWITVSGKKYGLANQHKTDRITHKLGRSSDEQILIEYDRSGGLIVDENEEAIAGGTFSNPQPEPTVDTPEATVTEEVI